MFFRDKLQGTTSLHNNTLQDRQTGRYYLQGSRNPPYSPGSLSRFWHLFGTLSFQLDKLWDKLCLQRNNVRQDKALNLSFESRHPNHSRIPSHNFLRLNHSGSIFQQGMLHIDHQIEVWQCDHIFREGINQALVILLSSSFQEGILKAVLILGDNRNQKGMTSISLIHLQAHRCHQGKISLWLYPWDNNYQQSICYP